MKKIIVTEENFDEVLARIQEICNKYKMLEFYRVFSEDMKEETEHRRNPIGFKYTIRSRRRNSNGELDYRRKKKFYYHNEYVFVTKYPFRESFENKDNSLNEKLYSEMKSFIHLITSGITAIVISCGDKIQFYPFGGFAVWTDNDYTRFDSPLTIYKHIFIPDIIKGKIEDLENEQEMRKFDIEEEDRGYEEYKREYEEEYFETLERAWELEREDELLKELAEDEQ